MHTGSTNTSYISLGRSFTCRWSKTGQFGHYDLHSSLAAIFDSADNLSVGVYPLILCTAGCQLKPFKPFILPSNLLKPFFDSENLFFFWKMSHFILFLASFPLILVFYSLFNHYYSTQEHSLEIFSLASLSIQIFFVHIMLESIFLPLHCFVAY